MSLITILLVVVIVLALIILMVMLRASGSKDNSQLQFDQLNSQLNRLDSSMHDEFARNRDENLRNSKDLREEIISTLKTFSDIVSKTINDIGKIQKDQLEGFALQLKTAQE